MITKEKHPMRVFFFRDHEISGLRLAIAPSPVSRPGGPGKDLSISNPVGRDRPVISYLPRFCGDVRALCRSQARGVTPRRHAGLHGYTGWASGLGTRYEIVICNK